MNPKIIESIAIQLFANKIMPDSTSAGAASFDQTREQFQRLHFWDRGQFEAEARLIVERLVHDGLLPEEPGADLRCAYCNALDGPGLLDPTVAPCERDESLHCGACHRHQCEAPGAQGAEEVRA